MTEIEQRTIKNALLQCAKENENKATPTFNIVVSSVCKSAAERITELEEQIEKMQCCRNCKYYLHHGSSLIYDRKEIMEHCDFNEARKINFCKNYKWELAE